MQGFAQFIDLLLRDFFGVESDFSQVQQDISGYVESFSDMVKTVLSHFEELRGLFAPFMDSSVFNFLSVVVIIWSIVIVARLIKSFVGG